MKMLHQGTIYFEKKICFAIIKRPFNLKKTNTLQEIFLHNTIATILPSIIILEYLMQKQLIQKQKQKYNYFPIPFNILIN